MSANAAILSSLCDLLEREARAIDEIDADALGALSAERRRLLAGLSPLTPAERELAERVEAARARNERAAEARLAELGRRLEQLARGRVALRGYTPGGTSALAARFVDAGA
jgi:hypothetical protein